MRKRRTMVLGGLAVLLIGGLVIMGCGTSKPKSPSLAVDVCASDDPGLPDAAPYAQTSGIHPVEYALQNFISHRWKSSYEYDTPSEWEPQNLAEVQLVACIVEELTKVKECSYTLPDGRAATSYLYQVKAVVTLREAQTGKVVATSNAMEGDHPGGCMQRETFSSGKTEKTVYGSRPEDDVNAWLNQYVEIP